MKLTRRPLLLGALAAGMPAFALAQTAADFAGDWYGALNVGPQQSLRLRFNVAAGPSVTLYSIDQGNAVIAATEVHIEGGRIDMQFPSVNAHFEGRLNGARIEGTFTQGAMFPLSLGRGPIAAPLAGYPQPLPAAGPLTQARLSELRAIAGSPGIGAAAQSNERRIAFADGLRAIDHPQTITTSDRWHLGSITKSMTATLVARAVEQGAVSWNDTVGDVLGRAAPHMRDEYRRVTFRHLCSHRSGLPGNIETTDLVRFPRYNEDPREDRAAYARIALAQAPVGLAEQTFTYSNSGFVLVGAMLEARMDAKWEALIQEHVFNPLGMTSAGQGAPGHAGAYDQPVGHAGGVLAPLPPGGPISDNPAVLGPAGRVHAGLADVLTFLAAHRDRTSFLRLENWDMLHTPPFGGDYAMGWERRGNALWHNGSNTLWYAEVMFSSARGVVAAAAVNDGRLQVVAPIVGAALQSAVQAVS